MKPASATDHVVFACQQIAAKGKNPSVAMIKAHSPVPLPMPAIIKGIQYWKANKATIDASVETLQNEVDLSAPWTLEMKDTAMAIQDMQQRIIQLEKSVLTLSEQLKAVMNHTP